MHTKTTATTKQPSFTSLSRHAQPQQHRWENTLWQCQLVAHGIGGSGDFGVFCGQRCACKTAGDCRSAQHHNINHNQSGSNIEIDSRGAFGCGNHNPRAQGGTEAPWPPGPGHEQPHLSFCCWQPSQRHNHHGSHLVPTLPNLVHPPCVDACVCGGGEREGAMCVCVCACVCVCVCVFSFSCWTVVF